MKLQSIRLHPFGHFTDESWDLGKPLVVVHGPNEKGKTTLRQAIFHGLFTPTNLSKSRLHDSVGPWLPLPAGDHAAVTLTFEHDTTTWTVQKRWGAGQASLLGNGTMSIADPASVQERLGEMLEHGEATFRHVLFTGQAELEQTLTTIEKKADELRDIRDLLRAVAGAAADVDEQKLRRLLDERIKTAFSRWDDASNKPERQNGQEKGVANPWKRDVGRILQAWYAWQCREAERREVMALEVEIDRVAAEVAVIEQIIRERDEFVATYAGLRTGLSERGELEERVKRLTRQVADLNGVFSGWPTAQASLDAWNKVKPTLETELGTLKEELALARTKRAGMATRAAFATIEKAKKAWDDAEAECAKLSTPGDEALTEIGRLEEAIKATEIRLAAQVLSWHLRADAARSATIVRGDESPEAAAIGPEGLGGTARGRVQIAIDATTVTVASGEDDVDALFRALAADKQRLAEQLETCGAESPAAARLQADRYRDRKQAAANAHTIYAGLLQGKTFAEWQAEAQVFEGLAGTREIDTIEKDLDAKRKFLSEGEAGARTHQQKLATWKTLYTDHATVGARLLADQGELLKAEERLRAVPGLPEGFASIPAFVTTLDAAQADQSSERDRLKGRSDELTLLTAALADRRSEDVAEEAEMARRTFEWVRAQGRTYLRIRAELDRLTAEADDDPWEAFGAKVAEMFSSITGREASLSFAGPVPASVERDGVSMPPERLSHGAGGTLALALRLAMAEAYLDGGAGFIMLDDPLVNLDGDRMRKAVAIVRDFSNRSQVIFFTCHDHHAECLQRTDQAEGSRDRRP